MAIRIHKILGYGLDTVGEDGSPCAIHPRDIEMDHKDFLAWLKEECNKPKQEKRPVDSIIVASAFSRYPDMIQECYANPYFHYDDEFGMANVLMMVPVTFEKWYRVDDNIDYAQEYDNICYPYIKKMDSIYPFRNFMNANTGDVIYFKEEVGLDPLVLQELTHHRNLNMDYYTPYGFRDEEDVRNNFVSVIPWSVQKLCEYLKLFNDPKGYLQLRPMLYTYWA